MPRKNPVILRTPNKRAWIVGAAMACGDCALVAATSSSQVVPAACSPPAPIALADRAAKTPREQPATQPQRAAPTARKSKARRQRRESRKPGASGAKVESPAPAAQKSKAQRQRRESRKPRAKPWDRDERAASPNGAAQCSREVSRFQRWSLTLSNPGPRPGLSTFAPLALRVAAAPREVPAKKSRIPTA